MAVIFSSVLADVACCLAAIFALLYLYMTRNFGYWKKRGVYSGRPVPFLGDMSDVFLGRLSIGAYLRQVYEQSPHLPYVGILALDQPVLVVRDLALVRDVLVKEAQVFLDRSFHANEDVDPLVAKNLFGLKGKKWRDLRVKLTPTFTSGKMKKMFYLVDECGKHLVRCLQHEIYSGSPVVVKEVMARYSTDVIASCAFGVNANALEDANCEFRMQLRKVFEPTLVQAFASTLAFFLPSLLHLLRLKTTDSEVAAFVRRTIWSMVDFRKKNGLVRKDFLDLLMLVREGGDMRPEDAKELEEMKLGNGHAEDVKNATTDLQDKALEGDDFVAQAYVFLLAGFETSSSVITFTLYELALNQDIQEKLRQEITTILDKNGGQLSYDVIAEMAYLEMVVSESMRKYPSLPFLDRKCSKDYEIPGTGLTLKKGMSVMIPIMGIHYDPKIYPDPEKFIPERFRAESRHERSNFSYLPFGEGPRICIGMRFGLMQVKTALVHVLSSFRVSPGPDTPEPPLAYKPTSVTLGSAVDFSLRFAKLN